jgi:hypothetical protein
MNTRLLGTICILCALAAAPEGVRVVLSRGDPDSLTYVLGLVGAVGTVCGVLGMRALRVAGNSRAGQWALNLMLAAEGGLGFIAILSLLTGRSLDPWPGVVGMVSVMAAIVAGVLALRAQQWESWRKFAPLAMPLALVLAVVLGIAGTPPLYLIAGSVAWLVIGYAVQSSSAVVGQGHSTATA